MKRMVRTTLTALALTCGSLLATTAPASAGQLACKAPWTDGTTFGIACSGGPYIAVAQCKNGRWVQGASASNYSKSYAYCSTVGSKYKAGTGYALYL
ncbi:hypothetical protein [Streptomyces sp. NPDC048442]|uniref:hypothetical protein n=1 Tax=Streptomyces sp. NPDC048442 TaxID=3154823 RepID=UPI00343D7672